MTTALRLCVCTIGLLVICSLLTPGCVTRPEQARVTPTHVPGTVTDGAPRVEPGTPIEDLRLLPDFYQTPEMPFITGPGEQVIPVSIESCTGAQAQRILEDERKLVPKGVFVVTIDGVITITDTSLAPKENTCLIFTQKAKIVAAPDCNAKELLLIRDTGMVSLSAVEGARGVLDGAETDVVGIRVENSGKVHLDRLAIHNCGEGGLLVEGRGDDDYANPVSLTRSMVADCGMNGVTVSRSPQFIALDNVVTGNGKAGMEISSPVSILANNICAGNDVGLHVLSPESSTITRNQLIANHTGLHLYYSCDYALVYENTIQDNQLGLNMTGMNATVGWNIFAANTQQVEAGGTGNLLQSNQGLTVAAASPGTAYFNPPTMGNPHQDAVIWKGDKEEDLAMERVDVTIASGRNPMDATDVNERLAAAREAHPGKVLVATLRGNFVVRTDDGIKVPDYTCILLAGTVRNGASEKQRPYLVSLKGRGCTSLSGGRIISDTSVFSGVTAQRASNVCLVDGIHVDLNSPHRHVGTKSINAVSAKQHGGSAFILRGSEIRDPGHRGVWMHAGYRMYTLGNRFYAGGMTIDFDAFCFSSAALYNTASGNTYHSEIFFEEAVKFNMAFANRLDIGKEECAGIAFHNQNVKGITEKNLSACNVVRSNSEKDRETKNRYGIGFTGRTKEHVSQRNYSFNDRVFDNQGYRPLWFNANAKDNYMAQTVLINSSDPVDFAGNVGFNSPE